MTSRRRPSPPTMQALLDEIRAHGVILEDMRSQNRLTIEAVETTRTALEERIDRNDRESRARDATLELAIRELRISVQQNTLDIQQNTRDIQQNTRDIQQNTAGLRELAGRVEALGRVEERVSALERRGV